MAREAGLPVHVDYPGFRCAPVVEEVYGRVIDGREAELLVRNLREGPLRGSFRISGAISSPASDSAVVFSLPSGERMEARLPCETIWTLETPPDMLPAGTSSLRLSVANPLAKKLLVLDVQFLEPSEAR